MGYRTLDFVPFGRDLLDSYDLDPIYPMLVKANLPLRQMKRWLLAYWCYYAAGPASYISEWKGEEFWDAMSAGIPTYPRGHERRHWRGNAARESLADLRANGIKAPEYVVDIMTRGNDFQTISKDVQSFIGFGPWIAWKIADMAERVLQKPVDFSNANLFMYRDPVRGAALLYHGDQFHPITAEELQTTIGMIQDSFRGYKAPPYGDRPLTVQEIETLLCKWKSHMNGHYPMGNDSFDIAHGLQGWGDTADCLYKCLKEVTTYEV